MLAKGHQRDSKAEEAAQFLQHCRPCSSTLPPVALRALIDAHNATNYKAKPFICLSVQVNGSCSHADDPAAPSAVTAEGQDVTNDRGTTGTLLRAKCAPCSGPEMLCQHQGQGQSCGEGQHRGTNSTWQLSISCDAGRLEESGLEVGAVWARCQRQCWGWVRLDMVRPPLETHKMQPDQP